MGSKFVEGYCRRKTFEKGRNLRWLKICTITVKLSSRFQRDQSIIIVWKCSKNPESKGKGNKKRKDENTKAKKKGHGRGQIMERKE